MPCVGLERRDVAGNGLASSDVEWQAGQGRVVCWCVRDRSGGSSLGRLGWGLPWDVQPWHGWERFGMASRLVESNVRLRLVPAWTVGDRRAVEGRVQERIGMAR